MNYLNHFIILSFFLILFFNFNDCQFSKYTPPNLIDYVQCYLSDGTPKSYCPNGTYCVSPVLANNLWYPGLEEAQYLASQFTSPGCCAIGTSPCFDPHLPFSVKGCCPDGQYCCVDKYNKNVLVGCADDYRQCCGSTICPANYSCCYQDDISTYYCCPGLESCSATYNITNSSIIITDMPNNLSPGVNPILTPLPYSLCKQVVVNTTTNNTEFVEWPLGSYVICGPAGNLCLNATEDCISRSGIVMDTTNPNITAQDFLNFGSFCCAKNTTPCAMSVRRRQHGIIGCADESIGESCCASQICPSGSKCCHFPFPPDQNWAPVTLFEGLFNPNNTFIPGVNMSRIYPTYDICCPEGTYCCAILLNLDKTLNPERRTIYGYCGRNANCTSFAMLSEMIQPIPSFNGFLPEYVEGDFILGSEWAEPEVRFGDAITNQNLNCNSCTYNDGCNSCSNSCQDQCALDITATCTK
jgi:hypothetical protein